jgi:hypothetical protein
MKNYLGGAPKNKSHNTAKAGATKNADNNDFLAEDNAVMMIFGGTRTRLKKYGEAIRNCCYQRSRDYH